MLKQEAHGATAVELQRLNLRALVPFFAKPVPPARLSVVSAVPWERFLNPTSPCVVDTMELLAVLSDGPNDVIQAVLNAGAVFGCLRVLGNICTGNDAQTQAVVNGGGVDVLASQLTSDVPSSRRAPWIRSTRSSGTLRSCGTRQLHVRVA